MRYDVEAIRARFGLALKRARKKKGLKQEYVAFKSGLTAYSIGAYERGAMFPNAESLLRICNALDISVDRLLEGVNEKIVISSVNPNDKHRRDRGEG